MRWLRRLVLVLGWGLVLASGWIRGTNDDADPGLLLAMLIAGGLIVIGVGVARELGKRNPGNDA